jgi:hypothetical protein
VITNMMGGSPAEQPQHYFDASSLRHLPLGVRQVIVAGQFEDQVPVPRLRAHQERASKAGDHAQLLIIPNVGHFELASPYSSAWPSVEKAIVDMAEGQGTN